MVTSYETGSPQFNRGTTPDRMVRSGISVTRQASLNNVNLFEEIGDILSTHSEEFENRIPNGFDRAPALQYVNQNHATVGHSNKRFVEDEIIDAVPELLSPLPVTFDEAFYVTSSRDKFVILKPSVESARVIREEKKAVLAYLGGMLVRPLSPRDAGRTPDVTVSRAPAHLSNNVLNEAVAELNEMMFLQKVNATFMGAFVTAHPR